MAVTQTDYDAALLRTLKNGETWEMGDIRSHLGLEKLLEARDQLIQSTAGVKWNLAAFQNPVAEAE